MSWGRLDTLGSDDRFRGGIAPRQGFIPGPACGLKVSWANAVGREKFDELHTLIVRQGVKQVF